ncbi:membrane transport protein, inner membrane component [Salmonella bongori]|nr:membrane transport protein, inner membrane component [Salmonella bongori]
MKVLAETKSTERIPESGNMPRPYTISRSTAFWQKLRRWWPFYLMAFPGVVYFFIWHYLPVWEAKIAFEQYRIIPPNIWVGMQYFATLMSSPVFWQVIQNTIIIGVMKLVFIFPVPILVALLLNEVRSSGYRKFVQSVIYLPHYLSWVVIASIAIATLSPVDGAVNDIIKAMGYDPIPFMTDSGSIRWVLVFTEMCVAQVGTHCFIWRRYLPSIRSFMKRRKWMAPDAGVKSGTLPYRALRQPSPRSSFSTSGYS